MFTFRGTVFFNPIILCLMLLHIRIMVTLPFTVRYLLDIYIVPTWYLIVPICGILALVLVFFLLPTCIVPTEFL